MESNVSRSQVLLPAMEDLDFRIQNVLSGSLVPRLLKRRRRMNRALLTLGVSAELRREVPESFKDLRLQTLKEFWDRHHSKPLRIPDHRLHTTPNCDSRAR